jgi:hypothetical protein
VKAIDSTPSVGVAMVVVVLLLVVVVVLLVVVDVAVDVDVDVDVVVVVLDVVVGPGHHAPDVVVGHQGRGAPMPARVPNASAGPSPPTSGPDAVRTTAIIADAIALDAVRPPATQQSVVRGRRCGADGRP